MYRIIRIFSDGRPRKRIKTVDTLELAQLHCNSPLTRGTLRSGVHWFDAYTEIRRQARPRRSRMPRPPAYYPMI